MGKQVSTHMHQNCPPAKFGTKHFRHSTFRTSGRRLSQANDVAFLRDGQCLRRHTSPRYFDYQLHVIPPQLHPHTPSIKPSTMPPFPHHYPFDPTYGLSLEQLLEIAPPAAPNDFASFWQERYRRTLEIRVEPHLSRQAVDHPQFYVHDLTFQSTGDFIVGGWLLVPREEPIFKGMVVGHGYGGRENPDFHWPMANTVYVFPCFRGLGRSRAPGVSATPHWHVLHDIQDRERYILAGCVEDLWLSVSAMVKLFPETQGHIGYIGTSFGGGIGALALPWDSRIRLAHLNVPTFGHMPLRLAMPTLGSGEAVRQFQRQHCNTIDTLRYYDAATAARYSPIPVHVAAAQFDPVVAPPGQFAVYNALPKPKRLFVLAAGHFQYPGQAEEEGRLLDDLENFFEPL